MSVGCYLQAVSHSLMGQEEEKQRAGKATQAVWLASFTSRNRGARLQVILAENANGPKTEPVESESNGGSGWLRSMQVQVFPQRHSDRT